MGSRLYGRGDRSILVDGGGGYKEVGIYCLSRIYKRIFYSPRWATNESNNLFGGQKQNNLNK